eukprot:CAMPEP_0171325742 /NCGR_PEP_ID=MMETSP0816-20121228/117004_1 /TAXON_ID=420281 /ORGANISM="Proboscia inermis, Strain CCAP1064/1" /LENGTH=420 /DNA_ID=CAMNT_0011825005 /DNA_START=706 /DNA_END=1968 /DNA_ORIENTATION=-
MIAQIVSQISSHFIVYYHRNVVTAYISLKETKEDDNRECSTRSYVTKTFVEEKMRSSKTQDIAEASESRCEPGDMVSADVSFYDQRNDVCEPLRLHTYQLNGMHEGQMLKTLPVVDTIIGVTSFSVIFLSILGCSIASFRLEILGLIGRAVELGEENRQAITRHSLFTIVQLMLDQAAYLDKAWNYIGLISLSALFIFSSLVAPLLQTVALIMMWYAPMKCERRKHIFFVIEILQAWQYVEVYLISIYIASWQMGDVSEFMINDYCKGLGDFFSLMAFYGVLSTSDSQCFYAMASIEAGWYVLLIAAILLAVLTKFVVGAANEQMKDSEKVTIDDIKFVECEVNSELKEEFSVTPCMKKDDLIKILRPLPVLFTERFSFMFISAYTFSEDINDNQSCNSGRKHVFDPFESEMLQNGSFVS